MTDEQGPVHYQISVTGRQVAAFFFLLLLALSLAFFFGMKTGAAARRGDEPRAVVAEEAEREKPREVKEDDSSLGFAKTGRPEPTPSVSGPSSAAVEDKRDEKVEKPAKPAEKPTEAPPAKATPKASPKPETTPKPTAAGKPTAEPVPTPKAADGKDLKAAPKAEAAKPAKKAFWVQAFASNNPQKVDDLARRLKEKGFKDVDVSPVPGKAGFFRLRIGPYADRSKADAQAKKLSKAEPSIKKPIIGS